MQLFVVQHAPTLSRANLSVHCEIVRKHSGEHDLIIFGELSLNGYLLQDKVFEDAYTFEELAPLLEASANTSVIVGAAIKASNKTFNSALYIEHGTLKHVHHKMHLPTYGMFEESRYFFKGEAVQGFETSFGKMALLVCEDLWRAETLQQLASMSLDMVVVIANSPVRTIDEDGKLEAQQQWSALLKSAAILANSMVLFVNRVGYEDGLCFYGGSMLFEAGGTLQWQLPLFEEQLVSKSVVSHQHSAQQWQFNID